MKYEDTDDFVSFYELNIKAYITTKLIKLYKQIKLEFSG